MRSSRLGSLLFALLLPGCGVSSLIGAHQPLRPLLDHAGQVDVSVHGGYNSETTSTLGAQVAYAPVDSFEIAAAFDADVADEEFYRTQHVGGGLALGWFVRDRRLRMEGFAGVNGGWGEGASDDIRPMTMSGSSLGFDLESTYVMPFIQGMFGVELPYFEIAGGGRLWAYLADVQASTRSVDGIDERDGYERAFIEPIVTVRVPIDWFRIETTFTMVFPIAGSAYPIPSGGFEDGYQWSLTAGFGVQIDTIAPPEDVLPDYAY